jgi:drug/metabolite transporter (DMT)-like permease
MRRPSTWQIQFIALAATWGASFLFIKVLDRHWPVLWVSLGRVALGAAALLVLVVVRGERLPTEPVVWLHCAVAAVLFNAGHMACAGAALCYGIGFPYTRRHLADRPESGVVLSAAQLLCATAMLAVFTPFARAPTVHIGLDGAGSLLALGALGSGVAFAINYAIVRAKGPGTASLVTYVMPVFSTVLGVSVLGETLHWNQPVGTVALLAGVAISQGRLLRSRPRVAAAHVSSART